MTVVLILGVLAAFALPQYQVAVRKSRMANLAALATSIAYYMASGTYTPDFEDLDISVPGTDTRFGANLCALLPKNSSVDYVYCGWSCRPKEEDPLCGNLYVVYFTFSRRPNVYDAMLTTTLATAPAFPPGHPLSQHGVFPHLPL